MTKNRDFQENREVIGKFIKGKQPGSADAYTKVGEKTGGSSSGYEAEQDSHRYMFKSALMNDDTPRNIQDKGDLVREYMSAPMFSRFLYNKTANIGIAIDKPVANFRSPKQASPDVAYIASRKIDGFEPLDDYIYHSYKVTKDPLDSTPPEGEMLVSLKEGELVVRSPDGKEHSVEISGNIEEGIPRRDYEYLLKHLKGGVPFEASMINSLRKHGVYKFGYPKGQELQRAEGIEKNLAACMFLGDGDYHGGNLGVVNQNGKPSIVKIDHGRAHYFSSNENRLRAEVCHRLNRYDYHGLEFDIRKLKESVDQIINISDEEIENLVKKNSYELKKLGVKLDDSLEFYENSNNTQMMASKSGNLSTEQDNRYANMEQNYIRLYKAQKQTFIKLSKNLDIIMKIDMPQEWKKRDWIHEVKGEDPIDWAINNQKTIQGIEPRAWAVLSGNRVDARLEEKDIDPVIKFRFYLANNELDKAKAEIKNIHTIGKNKDVLLEEANNLGNPEIVNVLEDRIVEIKTRETNVKKLLGAIRSGKLQEVKKVANSEVINTDFKGLLPLEFAIDNGHDDITKFLIDEGAKVNQASKAGVTALQKAASMGQIHVVNHLIAKGADLDAQHGNLTALHIAVNKGYMEVAAALVNAGANLEIHNKFGQTALEVAQEKNNEDLIKLIEEKEKSRKSKRQGLVRELMDTVKKSRTYEASTADLSMSSNATTRSNSLNRSGSSYSRL
jgi:uncharacterized protein